MRGPTPWIEEGWRWNFDEVMNDDSITNMKDWKRLRNQRVHTLIKDKEPLQNEPVSFHGSSCRGQKILWAEIEEERPSSKTDSSSQSRRQNIIGWVVSSLFVLVRVEPDLVAALWSTAAVPLNHAPRHERSVLRIRRRRRRYFRLFSTQTIDLPSLVIHPTAVSLGKGGVCRRLQE